MCCGKLVANVSHCNLILPIMLLGELPQDKMCPSPIRKAPWTICTFPAPFDDLDSVDSVFLPLLLTAVTTSITTSL